MSGAELIAKERQRQVEKEGWTQAHDAEHDRGEILSAGIAYATMARDQAHHGKHADSDLVRDMNWPWHSAWWKPDPDPIRNLVKAGALIAAEIDRLQHVPTPPKA
jgi:hypothetical protein